MALFNSSKKFFPWSSFLSSKTSFVWSSVRIWNLTTPTKKEKIHSIFLNVATGKCNLIQVELETMLVSGLMLEARVLQGFAGVEYFYRLPVEVKQFACVTLH